MSAEERIPIIEDGGEAAGPKAAAPWFLLIVDDDASVHQATRFALDGFAFEGRGLRILSAYSGAEARKLVAEEPDIAVILLDVVMESEYVGLELVRWIRGELGNDRVRIVLRTGQPGFAPELQVVRDYDINDYRDKSGMTATRLVTTVYAALRSYRDILRIERQSGELRDALDSAEAASRAKTSFIAHMSHEFRTPLNGIIGLSEMIANEQFGPVGNPKYKEYAWDIVSSGRRLKVLVESVLEIAEDGRTPLEFETFDLQQVIGELFEQDVREIGPPETRRRLARTAEPPRPLLLHADRNAVRTMLANLVTNAYAHNPPDCSVRVTARPMRDDGLVLSVIDDGTGIDPSVLQRLGDPFNFRSDYELAGNAGLGLGLVSTKKLIERLGGSLSIESAPGEGTTVRLIFPPGSLRSAGTPDVAAT
jgi:signal transduction histidine kinase